MNKEYTEEKDFYRFKETPNIRFWKEMSGRKMTVGDYEGLLNGASQELEGFTSKAGKPFKAKLKVKKEANKIEFDFPKREEKILEDVLCPVTGKPAMDKGTYFSFEGFPKVYCNKIVAKREMKAEEYRDILAGEGRVMEGFEGKKPFSAELLLNEGTRRFEFKFAEKKEEINIEQNG